MIKTAEIDLKNDYNSHTNLTVSKIYPINSLSLYSTNFNTLDKVKAQDILKESFPFLQPNEIEQFLNICELIKVKNKTLLIKGGDLNAKSFFILEGLIRGYFTNEKGVEKNIFLRPERTLTGDPNSLFHNLPAKYTFEAVGECTLLEINLKDLRTLIETFPKFSRIYISSLQEVVSTLIFRVESLIDKMPEKRYEQLIETHPQFFQKAYNKHIANYLGITSVSLSRIIKRKLDNRN